MQKTSSWQRSFLIVTAFFAVYFIWGATYLANKWAVAEVDPFLLAGLRFTLAGGLMLLLAWLVYPVKITPRQWRHVAFAGLLLFVVGNGGLVWVLQYLDSGLTALFVSFEPILVIALQRVMQRKTPHWLTLLGIASGVVGMFLLAGQPSFYLNPMALIALVVIFLSIGSWAYISIWLPSSDRPPTHFHSAAVQMLTGGLLLIIIAAINGSLWTTSLRSLSPITWGSFVFLVFGGSIIAFTSFNYLLSEVSTEKVVTNAYVNPVVALFLGWWLNQEVISPQAFTATLFLLGGVFLIHQKSSQTLPKDLIKKQTSRRRSAK
ncbi:MAG: EamA family transporter, partial [Bacteroidota bacterium]